MFKHLLLELYKEIYDVDFRLLLTLQTRINNICSTSGLYLWIDTSLYLIITNFHTELKPLVKVNHDMNSLTLALYTGLPCHRSRT